MEVGTIGFFNQFGVRPNRLMIEPLFRPFEIIRTVIILHWLKIMIIVPIMFFLGKSIWEYYLDLIETCDELNFKKKIITLIINLTFHVLRCKRNNVT